VKTALVRWRRVFLVVAVILDCLIILGPPFHTSGEPSAFMLVLPLRWLVMAGGFLGFHWSRDGGVSPCSSSAFATIYLILGFTIAGLMNLQFAAEN